MKTVQIPKNKRVVLPDLYVTVDMTEKDAEMFKVFKEHYNNFLALIDGRVFDVRRGKATIHFNASGAIKVIDINLRTL